MTCFGEETFGPVISLYRFHDEADAVARANDGEYGLNASIYSQDGARARAIARLIKCGTVNINEAFGATFASIDSPMGGMRESGMGRRQGGEGIRRYTESQSVATQRLMRFAPMLGMSDETYAKVMTANLRLMKKLGRRLMTEHVRLRRPRRRLGLRRLGHRAAADREGLPGRRARGRRAVRGRGLRRDHLRPQAATSSAPALGMLRHPAHRRRPRLADPGRRGRRRRLAGLRQHALRAARRRSTTTRSGRTSPTGRTSSRPTTTRPSGCSASSSNPVRTPSDEVMEKVADDMGVGRHLPPDAGRRLLRRPRPAAGEDGRRPLLRRRRPGPQRPASTAASA